MARKRRVFGPLFYSTLVVAVVVLVGLGARRAEPTWTTWRLTRQLGDSDLKVADRAAMELRRIGPDALPWVVRAARDRNARTRRNACWILAEISPCSRTAALALIAALDDHDPEVRLVATVSLGSFIKRVLIGIEVDDATVDRAIQGLRTGLDDQAPANRVAAVDALGTIGPRAVSVLADLERAGHDPAPTVATAVAAALAQVGPESPRVVMILRGLLRHRSPDTRRAAAEALKTLGPRAGPARADLEGATRDADPRVRVVAALALASVCPRDARVRAILCALLADPGLGTGPPDLRLNTKQDLIEALRQQTDEAAARDALLVLLAHPEAAVRSDALWCLSWNMAPSVPVASDFRNWTMALSARVISDVRKLLDDRDRRVRGDAAVFLIDIAGQEPDEAIAAALVASVQVRCSAGNEEDLSRLWRPIFLLRRLSPAWQSQAMPALVTALDRFAGEAHYLISCLGDLGPVAAPAGPKLVELAKSQDGELAAAALRALDKIDPRAAEEIVSQIVNRSQRAENAESPGSDGPLTHDDRKRTDP